MCGCCLGGHTLGGIFLAFHLLNSNIFLTSPLEKLERSILVHGICVLLGLDGSYHCEPQKKLRKTEPMSDESVTRTQPVQSKSQAKVKNEICFIDFSIKNTSLEQFIAVQHAVTQSDVSLLSQRNTGGL